MELFQYHQNVELNKLAVGTAKNYGATGKYLERFLKKKFKLSDIALTNLDYTFLADFENYLRTTSSLRKHQPLPNNGIMKHMELFKKIVHVGMRFGWLKNNPFSLYQLKYEDYDSDFLEVQELSLLRSN